MAVTSAPLPMSRGPMSEMVLRMLRGEEPGPLPDIGEDALGDDDVQLALWCLYELHYRGLIGVDPGLEWDPEVLRVRRILENAHLSALRDLTLDRLDLVEPGGSLPSQIGTLLAVDDGPSPAEYLRRGADVEQFLAFLRQRRRRHPGDDDQQ